MTRMIALHELLTGEPVFTAAQQEYERARREAICAELANDDRRLGVARMRMSAALHDRLARGE